MELVECSVFGFFICYKEFPSGKHNKQGHPGGSILWKPCRTRAMQGSLGGVPAEDLQAVPDIWKD